MQCTHICPLPLPSCYFLLTSPNSNDDASCIYKGKEHSLREVVGQRTGKRITIAFWKFRLLQSLDPISENSPALFWAKEGVDSLCRWKNWQATNVGFSGFINREEVKAGIGGRKVILITMLNCERRVLLGSVLKNKIKPMSRPAGFCIFNKGQSTHRIGGGW